MFDKNVILQGDCLQIMKTMPDNSIDCVVTSPPYFGLRSYVDANDPNKLSEVGLENSTDIYIERLAVIFDEVRRILKNSGTFWLNIGDTYSDGSNKPSPKHGAENVGMDRRRVDGLNPKNLLMIPARVAIALRDRGWYLRSEIIWQKPDCLPESVRDRPVRSHEMVYMLTKKPKYFYNYEKSSEPTANGKSTRNKRNVWTINTHNSKTYKHHAMMPVELARTCIKLGCPDGGVVFDPFGGAGTTAVAAIAEGKEYILCELNQEYIEIAKKRIGLGVITVDEQNDRQLLDFIE